MAAATFLGTGFRPEPHVQRPLLCSIACEGIYKDPGKNTPCLTLATHQGAGLALAMAERNENDEPGRGGPEQPGRIRNTEPRGFQMLSQPGLWAGRTETGTSGGKDVRGGSARARRLSWASPLAARTLFPREPASAKERGLQTLISIKTTALLAIGSPGPLSPCKRLRRVRRLPPATPECGVRGRHRRRLVSTVPGRAVRAAGPGFRRVSGRRSWGAQHRAPLSDSNVL